LASALHSADNAKLLNREQDREGGITEKVLVLLEELLLRIKTGVGVVCGKLLELCGMPLCANEKLHLNGGIGRVDRTLVDQALLDLLASDQLRLSTSVSGSGSGSGPGSRSGSGLGSGSGSGSGSGLGSGSGSGVGSGSG